MIQLISLILLAFAVSLDSFSVGFTYGLRKMHLPQKSIMIIACCSALTMILAMEVGKFAAKVVSPEIAGKIGGAILVGIGIWVLIQFFRPPKQKNMSHHEKTLLNFEIKSLGVVIHVLRKPLDADFDNSGMITGFEAIILGMALSLDAFGAGIGAALIGFSPYIMAIAVALMSSLFLTAGIKFGKFFTKVKWMQKFTLLPGFLLIIIGILKF